MAYFGSVLTSGMLAALALSGAAVGLAQEKPPIPGVAMIDLDGRPVRVQAIGLQDRRPGEPLVVFEAGASNSLEVWGSIVPAVASTAPVVAYDRAGLGRSEWDGAAPTPQHVADRLRRILRQIGASPPYVLVGYSWGGMLARYFAGYHPGDLAGLIFVDPGPMVTESLADNLTPFEAIGAGRAGFDAYWSSFTALMAKAPPAVRAEMQVFRGLLEADMAARDLRPLPALPMAVVVAGKYLPVPIQVPFALERYFQADLRYRLKVLTEWVLASPHGTLVMANDTTHAIPREDPDLVVSAVRRVLSRLPTREMVIHDFRHGLAGVRAGPDVHLSVSPDPDAAERRVLIVEYPGPAADPAARDIQCVAERQDWTAGRAITFQAKPENALRLSVSFVDRHHVAYTAWRDLKAGEWQPVRIAFDEIRPNPYFQPPDATPGAPLDVSAVPFIAFAPQDPGAGRLELRQFVISQ